MSASILYFSDEPKSRTGSTVVVMAMCVGQQAKDTYTYADFETAHEVQHNSAIIAPPTAASRRQRGPLLR